MNTRYRTSALVAAAFALSAALPALANDSKMSTEELAATVEQRIHLLPNFSSGTGHYTITVEARDNQLLLRGFIDGLEERNAVNRVVRNTAGVHPDMIDDHIVIQ